jgi:hypothetical protein
VPLRLLLLRRALDAEPQGARARDDAAALEGHHPRGGGAAGASRALRN